MGVIRGDDERGLERREREHHAIAKAERLAGLKPWPLPEGSGTTE